MDFVTPATPYNSEFIHQTLIKSKIQPEEW